jgi:hypothetical protein
MSEKEYKLIAPEPLPPHPLRVPFQRALDYLAEVKACSRYDLNMKFSPHVIRRLLKHETVGFINLCRQSPKYKVHDLFVVPTQLQSKLFIVYLKDEKEALVEYLAGLIKKPLNKESVRALSWRLKSLDDRTRLRVIQRAGYDQLRRYDACVDEFLASGLKSARADFPDVKASTSCSRLSESVDKKGLKDKVAVCKRKGKVFMVRLD